VRAQTTQSPTSASVSAHAAFREMSAAASLQTTRRPVHAAVPSITPPDSRVNHAWVAGLNQRRRTVVRPP